MRSALALLMVFSVGGSIVKAQSAPCCEEHRNISVAATESVAVDAELAIVRVGYRLYGPDAKTVYAKASETSNAIMQALTSAGVSKSTIESTSQVLQRTSSDEMQGIPMNSAEWVRRQFTVVQGWAVRVNPDDASKTLNTAINAGANESGWIQWTVQNESALRAQVSAKALMAARGIAEQMAQKLNVHLGALVTANENPQGLMFNGVMDNSIPAVAGAFGMGQPQISPLAINSRRVQIDVTVMATFSIE